LITGTLARWHNTTASLHESQPAAAGGRPGQGENEKSESIWHASAAAIQQAPRDRSASRAKRPAASLLAGSI
jgi:hypothetical protein